MKNEKRKLLPAKKKKNSKVFLSKKKNKPIKIKDIILPASTKKNKSKTKTEIIKGNEQSVNIIDTQQKLAAVLDVSVRTIQNWVKAGLTRNKQGHFDLKMVHDWRFNNVKSNTNDDGSKKEKDYESEYRKFKARLVEIDWKERTRQLVNVKDVEKDSVLKIIAVKQKFLSLPRMIAPQLLGLTVQKIEEVIRLRVEEIIDDFAEGRTAIIIKKKK